MAIYCVQGFNKIQYIVFYGNQGTKKVLKFTESKVFFYDSEYY